MTVSYSDIAARGLERISALSDGVFAIAMTLRDRTSDSALSRL